MGTKETSERLTAAVSPTDIAGVERELKKLEQRRAKLAESLDGATSEAIAACAMRRELIIANRDQQALEGATAKVREAEERRVVIDDAVRTLDRQIIETTARLAEARDKTERDHVAQVLEALESTPELLTQEARGRGDPP